MKDLSKHYNTLTPHERFQLALKATARGDENEAEQLHRTCPKKTYRMNEADYTARHEILERFIAGFLSNIEQARGKLMVHQCMQESLKYILGRAEDEIYSAYYFGYFSASEKRPSKKAEESVKKQINDLRSMANRLLAATRKGIFMRVKADFEAFDAACLECIGLDAKIVIAGAGASEVIAFLNWKEIEHADDLDGSEHVESKDETEYVEELYDLFITSWAEHVENVG